jgi:polyhydroxybutyrate depolymerase
MPLILSLANRCVLFATILLLATARFAIGQSPNSATHSEFEHWEFKVDGVRREALAYIPPTAKEKATPVVFVFHGHGGQAQNAARMFEMNRHWPEAISIYMQGLNTPGKLTDKEGNRPGWQMALGDQDNRDLKFFDAVLARLKKDYKLDSKRIFSTGHSNGGAFTYLLWAERGEVLAAVAPSAGMTVESLPKLKPKPVMHIAGEKDALVKFEWQERTIAAVRKINGCEPEGKSWDKDCTIYPSKTGTPVIAYIHSGGHVVPAAAPELIVKFFKELSK